MKIGVKITQTTDKATWDEYVEAHSQATLYHLYNWKSIIENTYGRKTYYLMAIKDDPQNMKGDIQSVTNKELNVVGILPMVHLKHFLFGNSLISLPYFDMAGILANDIASEESLLIGALKLGERLKVDNIELRHTQPLSWFDQFNIKNSSNPTRTVTNSHKVRMLFDLPATSEILMKSFKSKLRSQIKKPLKEGLKPKIGGIELIDDFYKVFSINMRDLGSPVHSVNLMKNILKEFPDQAKITVIYKDDHPFASSIMLGFKDTIQNPWASALRQYSRFSPNMLLYWTMLEYACDNGYAYFDFGRSSPNEGTYKFKIQWGAKPFPLFWHNIYIKRKADDIGTSEKSKFNRAMKYWQKLPVVVTKIIGPLIRKNIGL